MLFDAVKRLLGIGGNQPRQENESQLTPSYDRLFPYREQVPPDLSQIESEIAQVHKFMEEQMRSMMSSFGFTFGGPFVGFGIEDDNNWQFRTFPFPPTPDFPPAIPGPPAGAIPNPPSTVLDPRDEVLKPQFRSRSPHQWSGQDQVLDDRVNNEGLGSIIEELKPSRNPNEGRSLFSDNFSHFFGSGPFGSGIFSGLPEADSFSSSSTVTIFSNVNGHTSMEKIVKHPDGKIERTVITNDGNADQ